MDPITCACWMVLTLGSQHIDNSGMNTSNPGFGVEVNDWGIGEYANSVHRTSIYAGKMFWIKEGVFYFGASVGGVSGYQRKEEMSSTQTVYHLTKNGMQGTSTTYYKRSGDSSGAISPMVAPFMSIEGKHVGVNLVMLPDPTYWKQSAIGLQVKFRM